MRSLSYDPNSSVPSDAEPYVAKVIVEAGEVTEAYPNRNPSSDTDNWNATSGGSTGSPFINVRDNETFPNSCGINILLVLDRSGSIDPFKETYRDAARAFVNALDGTPTQIGILSFSAGDNGVNSYQDGSGSASFTHSPLDLSVAGNATTLNSTIDSVYTAPTGGTNWDRALQKSSEAKGFVNNGATGQTTNADVVVFITDGNPTARSTDGSDTGVNVDLIDLTAGMASANLVKNQEARALAASKLKMYALGVGSGVTPNNLKAVSGPILGEDYETPTVDELTAKLRELAARTCGARIFVRKHLAGNPADQADWGYSATTNGGMISYLDGNPRTHATSPGTIETGVILTQLPVGGREVTVTEDSTGQPLDEFNLDSVTCSSDSYDGAPVAPVANTEMGVRLAVQRGSALYCTFTNSRKLPHLTISKTPNNETINAGEDAEFSIVVTNTGSGTARDVVLTDTLPAEGNWTISEDPGGCSIAAGVLTCDFGDLAAGASRTVKIKTATSFAQCTTYNNDASVASSTEGTVDDNGNVITCLRPNLTIVKTPDDGTINAGEDAEFTIVIGNSGDGVAKNVTLSDQLPAPGVGGWVVSQQPSQGTCSIDASNLLTCADMGDLAKNQTRTIKVKTGTSNEACAVYDNPIATADASNGPPVSDGGSITCLKDATVTVIKDAQPDAAQDFDYTVTGAGWSDFLLDDDADATLPSSRTFTFSGDDAGSKTITESAVSGWSNTSLVCSEGTVDGSTATLQVDPGDEITCTYVNKQDATVTVIKDAQPDAAQDFDFTTTGSQLSDFSLDDDADPTLPSSRTFTFSGGGFGSKAITEGDAAGWALTDLACDDDDFVKAGKTAQLDVEPGEDITCTFVNKKAATVTIVKDAQPNAAQDFDYTTTGAGLSDFSLDDNADPTLQNEQTFVIVGGEFGSKTITESAVAGWSNTSLVCSEGTVDGSTATLQVDPGDEITCTYVNKQDATVTVIKDAQPDAAQDFDFTTTGSQLSDFSLDDDADPTLPSSRTFTFSAGGFGSKSITESAVAGWSNTSVVCSEGTVNGSTATLQLNPGDDVTCTYVNKQDATVTIVKDAVPNDAQDFEYTTTGAGLSGFSLDDNADATLSNTKVFTVSGADFGSKSITESAQAGWDLTALECSEGDANLGTRTATLSVDPGDAITCTFTNTERGSASVEKTEGGSSDLQRDWVFELSGDGIAPITSSTAGGNPILFDNLRPDTYTLCEVDMPIEWHSSLERPPHNGTRTEDDAANTARVCIEIDIVAR